MSEFFEFIRVLDAFLTWPMVFFLGIVGFLLSVVAVKVYERAEHEYYMASIRVCRWQHDRKQRAHYRRHQKEMRALRDAQPKPIDLSHCRQPVVFPVSPYQPPLPTLSAGAPSCGDRPQAISLRKDVVGSQPPVRRLTCLEEEAEARRQREAEWLRNRDEEERRASLMSFAGYSGASEYYGFGCYNGR